MDIEKGYFFYCCFAGGAVVILIGLLIYRINNPIVEIAKKDFPITLNGGNFTSDTIENNTIIQFGSEAGRNAGKTFIIKEMTTLPPP